MTDWDIRHQDTSLLGENGIQLTQGLFYEFKPESCVYTLSTRDKEARGKIYPSLPRIFMECIDEYDAAMRLVGNMDHWRKLCSLQWFLDGIPERGYPGMIQLRNDMDARDASMAKKILMDNVEGGNVNASKYLYDNATKGQVKKVKEEAPEKTSTVASIVKHLNVRG